jgi:hypothetical protein
MVECVNCRIHEAGGGFSDTQRGIHHSARHARAAQVSAPVTGAKTQLNDPQKTRFIIRLHQVIFSHAKKMEIIASRLQNKYFSVSF